jgi:adenylate cyclase
MEDTQRIRLRIGVNLGDILVEGSDIYGDGVNVAARLEGLADPGGICISDAVRLAVGNKLPLEYVFMGEQAVKNIKEPLSVYQVQLGTDKSVEEDTPNQFDLELPDKPSIAVLPFTNMSGDPEQEYFSDGVTEDIITSLSYVSGLLVVARHSTLVYKGQAVDVKQVGQDQGVRYVLEGSIRKAGNRVRVTAQLIDATSGHHVWADQYNRELDDIFSVQDDITQNVTIGLQVELTAGEEARVWAKGTKSIEAWQCVFRTHDLVDSHIQENIHAAHRLAEQAIEIDPNYANAWARLGWAYYVDGWWEWSDSRDNLIEQALSAGHKALELDGENIDAHVLIGICSLVTEQYEDASNYTQRAVKLSPSNAFVAGVHSFSVINTDGPREAIIQIKKAMRLSPIYPAWFVWCLGTYYYFDDQVEIAITTLKEAFSREPESLLPLPLLANALFEQGLVKESHNIIADILRLDPEFSVSRWARIRLWSNELHQKESSRLSDAGLPD